VTSTTLPRRGARPPLRAGTFVRGAFAVLLAAQLACTAAGAARWPLMPYDFFARAPRDVARHFRFVVEPGRPGEVEVESARLVPIEFFKAAPYVNNGLVAAGDDKARAAFVFALFDEAQAHPWQGFDETWSSAPPATRVRHVDYVLDEEDVHTGAVTRSIVYRFERP